VVTFVTAKGSSQAQRENSGREGQKPLDLLGEGKALVTRYHHRPYDLVPGDRHVERGACSRLRVLLEREKDVREAALVAALTEEGDRLLQLELVCLLGDLLVRLAEDVLCLHRVETPPFAPVSTRMPIPMTSNLARRDRSADNVFVGEREKRLARNETLYREANERVAEVAAQLLEGETDTPGGFICECDVADCTELIPMTLAEYEAMRAVPIRFAVVPGHELPEIESVVERHPAYLVVEKRDDEAQEVARETDPRA